MATLTYDDYTIGWICAIPVELAASMTMMDEKHPSLPQQPHDPNSYILGRVGTHNVVMACLPAGYMGTTSAAIVAAHMRERFRKIRFGLMVGIGGGVPTKNDVRLGDIVIGKPGTISGGVTQYDFGKSLQGGVFIRTGSLNAPPQVLLGALSTFQANHILANKKLAQYLSEIPEEDKPTFAHPGVDEDQLFEADYVHVGGETCKNCSKTKHRDPRSSSHPVIHYGNIGSANLVVKDSAYRDRLASEYDVLCVEMESAGLMNNFPCLVIRGICDYADSHKNKKWQPYAAAAAAACAKEFLSIIPSEAVANTAVIPTPVPTPVPTPISTPLSTRSSTPLPTTSSRSLLTPSSTNISGSEYSSSGAPPSAQELPKFFSRYHLFPSNSVALGRLILNTNCPDEDFFPGHEKLVEGDVVISHRRQLRTIVESARRSKIYHKIIKIFSSLTRDTKLPEVQEKTYSLQNSGGIFTRLCNDEKAQKWFEQTIKHGWNVYMVVEIHTVCNPSIEVSGLETRVSSLDISHSTENGGNSLGFPAAGEQVFAVRYRKVGFKWFSSGEMEEGFLNVGCNRWTVFANSSRGDVPEEIVEAELQNSIVKEDIEEGEVCMVGEEMIVVDED